MLAVKIIPFVCLFSVGLGNKLLRFPDHFEFGAATASYQVEGAWNISDKSENVWDHWTHHSGKVKDHSNGDIACDSYHNYKRDVEMLREMGVTFYRFSISWTRLMPDPFSNRVSADGLQYYNNLIDELLRYNITPMVTLFHWDTPYFYTKMGGWTNPFIVDQFVEYANACFREFGDRVKIWLTFNEAYNMCLFGHGTIDGFLTFAPDLGLHGFGEYQCGHNVLLAHGKAYRLYDKEYREKQQGRVSMAIVVLWAEPETDSLEDKQIVEKGLEFNTGWFANPIFSKEGDYPKVMREEIDRMSKMQGFKESRLPRFTKEEIDMIKGSADFIGLNYYTAIVFRNTNIRPTKYVPSYDNDLGYEFYQPDEWPVGASKWLKLRPTGLRDMLNWFYFKYGQPEIMITENGLSTRGGLKDFPRINFFNDHLEQVLLALEDGVNVTKFTAWSLMDNFEWANGYSECFGMYQVDFKSPERTRTPRLSVFAYKRIIETRIIDRNYIPPQIEYMKECDKGDNEENVDLKKNPMSSIIIALIIVLVILSGIIILMLYRRSRPSKKPLRI